MSNSPLSKGQANLQLILWEKNATTTCEDDLYVRIQSLGLPLEVVSQLYNLAGKTKELSGRFIPIGKIILIQILDFIEENLFLVSGIGAGLLVGSAISSLIVSVPIVGVFLAPLAKVTGITLTTAGAMLGHEIDKKLPTVGKSLREVADTFFQFFSQVLMVLFDKKQGHQTLPAS